MTEIIFPFSNETAAAVAGLESSRQRVTGSNFLTPGNAHSAISDKYKSGMKRKLNIHSIHFNCQHLLPFGSSRDVRSYDLF